MPAGVPDNTWYQFEQRVGWVLEEWLVEHVEQDWGCIPQLSVPVEKKTTVLI